MKKILIISTLGLIFLSLSAFLIFNSSNYLQSKYTPIAFVRKNIDEGEIPFGEIYKGKEHYLAMGLRKADTERYYPIYTNKGEKDFYCFKIELSKYNKMMTSFDTFDPEKKIFGVSLGDTALEAEDKLTQLGFEKIDETFYKLNRVTINLFIYNKKKIERILITLDVDDYYIDE